MYGLSKLGVNSAQLRIQGVAGMFDINWSMKEYFIAHEKYIYGYRGCECTQEK